MTHDLEQFRVLSDEDFARLTPEERLEYLTRGVAVVEHLTVQMQRMLAEDGDVRARAADSRRKRNR